MSAGGIGDMGMSARDTFAVIGGSGAHQVLQKYAPNAKRLDPIPTPFGLSGALYRFRMGSARFLFLPRHGETGHEIAAPWVNYRANIYALKEQGVMHIMSWSGPGAIDNSLNIGEYVLPDDLIDETRGRESSFFKGTGLSGFDSCATDVGPSAQKTPSPAVKQADFSRNSRRFISIVFSFFLFMLLTS